MSGKYWSYGPYGNMFELLESVDQNQWDQVASSIVDSMEYTVSPVSVGIPEFLNGIEGGVETHVTKLETEIGDLNKLLVTRTFKLKKLGIPYICSGIGAGLGATVGIVGTSLSDVGSGPSKAVRFMGRTITWLSSGDGEGKQAFHWPPPINAPLSCLLFTFGKYQVGLRPSGISIEDGQ
ncbi:hypothetical protein Ancab_029688 [Ancistrocladus abbreviatus]